MGLQFYSTNADGTLGAVAVSKSQNPRQDSVRGASDRRYIGQGNGRGRFGLSRSDMVRCGQDRSRMSFRRQCERVSVARESQRSIAWDRVPWKDRWSQMMPCPDEIGRCGSREAKGGRRGRDAHLNRLFSTALNQSTKSSVSVPYPTYPTFTLETSQTGCGIADGSGGPDGRTYYASNPLLF